MESIRDYLGCSCTAHRFFSKEYREFEDSSKTPGHTFPWAHDQYAEDRPVLPVHQALELDVQIEKEEISGVSTIDFKVVHKEVELIKIDAVDLQIHDVQIGLRGQWQKAAWTVAATHTTITLPAKMLRGDQGQIKIVYSVQNPRAGIYFIKPDEKYQDRPVQVWTQGQDDDARYWFPCFDEPRIKCSYDIKINVPAGFIATSNGALHSEVKGGKTWTFHWKTQFQIPAYLVTLTVGKFSEIKEEWRGKPVVYLVEKGREAEAKVSFGKTPKMLEYFSQKIGVDYPYEKYTQVAVSEFVFGGMENTSATTQTDLTLHGLEIEEDYSSDDLVAHELAHQWFGDLVTCRSWSEGWLNEGWATFMEYVFKEHDMGPDEAEYFRLQDLQIYLDEDSEFRRPIVTKFYADPAEIWDRHTYQKAGLVLQMLKAYVGDADFWAGTKKYLDTHRGGFVETVDFQRALEQASGINLQNFFDQWIYKTGYAELSVDFSWDEKSKVAKVKIQQKQKTDERTPVFKLKSNIEFYFEDGSTFTVPVEMTEPVQSFYIPLKQKPDFGVFDKGGSILKTLELKMPQDMAEKLLKSPSNIGSKVWLIRTWAKEPTTENIETIGRVLKQEAFWGVRAEAAEALGGTKRPRAKSLLLEALKTEKKSKTKAQICAALGQFKDKDVVSALSETYESEKNIFVKAAAIKALGKTKDNSVQPLILKSIKTESWHDVVAAAGYAALKSLQNEEHTDLFLKGAQYGEPKLARLAAIAGLSEVTEKSPKVRDFLLDTLEDPHLRARYAAAAALVATREPRAIAALEDSANRAVDGHYKAMALRSIGKIRKGIKRPVEIQKITEKLDKLGEENKMLLEKLEKLDQRLEAPKT